MKPTKSTDNDPPVVSPTLITDVPVPASIASVSTSMAPMPSPSRNVSTSASVNAVTNVSPMPSTPSNFAVNALHQAPSAGVPVLCSPPQPVPPPHWNPPNPVPPASFVRSPDENMPSNGMMNMHQFSVSASSSSSNHHQFKPNKYYEEIFTAGKQFFESKDDQFLTRPQRMELISVCFVC